MQLRCRGEANGVELGLNEPQSIFYNFCSKRKEDVVVVINLENLSTKVFLSLVASLVSFPNFTSLTEIVLNNNETFAELNRENKF